MVISGLFTTSVCTTSFSRFFSTGGIMVGSFGLNGISFLSGSVVVISGVVISSAGFMGLTGLIVLAVPVFLDVVDVPAGGFDTGFAGVFVLGGSFLAIAVLEGVVGGLLTGGRVR